MRGRSGSSRIEGGGECRPEQCVLESIRGVGFEGGVLLEIERGWAGRWGDGGPREVKCFVGDDPRDRF